MTRILKLINGETIVGSWSGETKTHYLVSDPLKVETHSTSSGRYSILTFWIPLADEPLQIPLLKGHVVVQSEVTADVHENYTNTVYKMKHPKVEEELPEDEEDLEQLLEYYKDMMMKRTLH